MTHLFRTTLASCVALFFVAFALSPTAHAQEQLLGTEIVDPGIQLDVLVAPKDAVTPSEKNLPESKTDVHLEVLATWAPADSVEVPAGAKRGGFVGFLHMFARVTNDRTGRAMEVSLVPHINLSDNLHYARNISLPGAADDPYTVELFVEPPQKLELSYHRDWRETYGSSLFEAQSFTYAGVQMGEVVAATR
jgi:uncharacterized protein involved in high-affinity Fe2+ transport